MAVALLELPCPIPLPKSVVVDPLKQQPQSSCGPAKLGEWHTRQDLATEEIGQENRQELLWHQFFLDPRQWWDKRRDKPSPRHPDFGHKGSKQVLWLNSSLKPGCVGLRLARWDAELSLRGTPPSTSAAGDGDGRMTVESILRKRCEEGELSVAVGALDSLVQRGCRVTSSLFYPVLKRCMVEKDLVCGRHVHAIARRGGYESNSFVANHIIGMYASHGKLEDAAQVFTRVKVPNAYMWASIILAHARHGQSTEAIEYYRQMRKSSVEPDNPIFVAVLTACASAADLVVGKEVHADILASAVNVNSFLGSSLVNMYAKCGSLEDARRVFDTLPSRNVVTWTAMLAAYAQLGHGREALDLYASMQQQGTAPADRVTFLCLLQACASVGAVQQGKELHTLIRRKGLEADANVANSLVDMYAKCANLEEARRVFDRLTARNLVTWNALLSGYAEHGQSHRAMTCFKEMQQEGVEPDGTTFISLLVACSHAGLVHEGRQYFRMMEAYAIMPSDYHYNCLVDLLGRSGCLDEAEDILQTMPFQNNVVGWTSLLNACKNHNDAERGRRCFDCIVKLVPNKASAYVLLGTIYANAGRWEDVEQTESLRKSAHAWKKPAKACIEVKNKVHEFTVGEERSDISSKLTSVTTRLIEEGSHVPHTELVLKAVSEHWKEDALCGHAEKLALAYGILNTPDGTTLLVTKNLRMCNDCHSSTKIMSRLQKREIIVRDAQRVHCFLDGSCSCGDRH